MASDNIEASTINNDPGGDDNFAEGGSSGSKAASLVKATSETKRYECSECDYQTNHKRTFRDHKKNSYGREEL